MPEITVWINGRTVTVPTGTLIAAAIARAGVQWCRRSVRGEARGPLCGMGICFECRATVNGVPHVRTCQRLCEPEMEITTDA
jgi:sarcosine oxidase subunit alpha